MSTSGTLKSKIQDPVKIQRKGARKLFPYVALGPTGLIKMYLIKNKLTGFVQKYGLLTTVTKPKKQIIFS